MTRISVFALLIVLLLSRSGGVYAQCEKINGRVLSKPSGEALPGAYVRVVHDLVLRGVSTDDLGKFELDINTGDSLLVSFIGYEDQVITGPQPCDLRVELIPAETSLQEVVIQSERLIAEEFSIKKLNKLDIYTNPSAKADPLLAVNSTPSATTTDESANISLRGSNPAETGIFLNNVPINDAVRYAQLNGIGTFSIFNTALISQVQIYPGNPPLEFGNTTSGLVALYTDEVVPEKNLTTVSASLASLGFYTQHKLTKSSSLTAFSNYQPSGLIRWFNKTALERLKGFTTVDLGLHYFVKISDRTTAKVFNYSNTESFHYQTFEPTYSGIFNQKKIRNFTVTNLRHRLKKGELSWNSGLSFSKSDYSVSTTQVKIQANDFFSSVNYHYAENKYELKIGVSYDYRGADFKGKFPQYDFALGEQFPIDSLSQSESVKVPEGYLYAKYHLSSRWIIGTGIRKNIPTRQQPDFLSSQVNLCFKPAVHWNLMGSAGRYNKMVLGQGDQSTPLLIQTGQYSIDANYSKYPLEISTSLFIKRGRQSETTSRIRGVEIYGRYRFNEYFLTQLSLTSLSATESTQGKTISSPYDIHYFVRGNAEYKFGGTWTATLVFLFRQGSFYRPVISAEYHPVGAYQPFYGDQKRLPDYNLVDLSLSKLMIWGDRVSSIAFCGISNLPNFKNVRDYSYNFDYTMKSANHFSLRTFYFGCILNF